MNTIAFAKDLSITITIGGIGVRLVSNSKEIVDLIWEHYSGFCGNTGEQLILFVNLISDQKHVYSGEVHSICRLDDIQFLMPPCEGKIDFSKGNGEIYIVSNQPFAHLDYVLRMAFAYLSYRSGGFLAHAAGILHNQWGYLFFGPSGSGKTTVAQLSKGETILNDDLLLILRSDLGWMACSTPFTNPSQVSPTAINAPIRAIFRLVQDHQVFLEKMHKSQSLAELVSNIPVLPSISGFLPGIFSVLERFTSTIPVYRLHFLPEPSFWQIIDRQLNGMESDKMIPDAKS